MDEIDQQAWEEILAAARQHLARARSWLRQDIDAADREIAVADRLLDTAQTALDAAPLGPVGLIEVEREPYAPNRHDEPADRATLNALRSSLVEPLTPREHEVLQLLAAGLRNKEIALRLGVSERTATFHVGNVLAKLGADSRTEAVHFARLRGLVRD